MPKPYTQKVKELARDVARKGPISNNPSNFGPKLHHIHPFASAVPSFLHGHSISFKETVSEKGKNRFRRVILPQVTMSALFSRALNMSIYSRISPETLNQIQLKGGFDEYVLSCPKEYLNCSLARMYYNKIKDVYDGNDTKRSSELALETEDFIQSVSDLYGQGYVE